MSTKRILVVDDDSSSRRFFELCLGGWGFDTVAVNNGEDAQAVLADDAAFDLIITDVMMPFETGFELTQALKKSPRTAKIPILATSAFHDWDQARKEGELIADAFVTKPVSRDALRKAVDGLLAKSGA